MCWVGVGVEGGYSEKVKNWKGMKDMDSKLFSLTVRHITLGGGNETWKDR